MTIQKQMEMKHRLEEDDLYKRFAKQREAEDEKLASVIDEEWEAELAKITSRSVDESYASL